MRKFHVVSIFLPVDLRTPPLLYMGHRHVYNFRIKFLMPNCKNALVIENKPNINLFARSPFFCIPQKYYHIPPPVICYRTFVQGLKVSGACVAVPPQLRASEMY